MGIVNVTPDSFFDGGRYSAVEDALKQASKLLSEGADILDIGAYSSRPHAEYVSEDEEIDRLIPFIGKLREKHPDSTISFETFPSKGPRAALHTGRQTINTIHGARLG